MTSLKNGVLSSWRGRRALSVFFAVLLAATFVIAQTPPAFNSEKTATAAPEHPITLEQLRTLVQQERAIEPMKQLTLQEAERQRKTLPPWFPSSVWDAVEKRIMAIDIPAVLLPTYQRYLSRENADAMILFFQGPRGAQIAEHFTQREAASAYSGTSGAATTARALDETSRSGDIGLAAKRMSELSPEDQKRVFDAKQVVVNTWKAISDETAVFYDNLVNNEIQNEIAAHNRELVTAKQVYLRKSTSSNPAQH